ncbi:TPA: hypothetical protein ACGF3N_000770 [Vibrio cholerae]
MNKHETLLKAVGRLNYYHCFVIRTSGVTKMPVIEIANPCGDIAQRLMRDAVEVTELRHGTLNKMYVTKFCGCLVRWWSSECQQYVGNTVINSQENQHEKPTFLKNLQALRNWKYDKANTQVFHH